MDNYLYVFSSTINDEVVYWSDVYGWVGWEDADLFTTSETEQPPTHVDGFWLRY